MSLALRTRGSYQLRRIQLVHVRHLHRTILTRKKHDDEEFEIDLITLKRRPKRKTRTRSSNGPAQNQKDDVENLKENLFQEAMKIVEDDTTANEPHSKPVKVRMPLVEDTPVTKHEENIVNVQKPVVKEKVSNKANDHSQKLLSELTELHPSERADRIEDILRLVSLEVPNLSKEATKLADDINDNILKMKEIRSKINEAKLKEDEAIRQFRQSSTQKDKKAERSDDVTVKIKREDLENFLKDAKLTKERSDEDNFREQRRLDYVQSLNHSRTLEKGNFFTPIDERLIRSVKRGTVPRIITNEDELLFPTLPKVSGNAVHEWLTYVNDKEIITGENPLGKYAAPQDLVSIFNRLDGKKKYLKKIKNLENLKWRLIGERAVGTDGHILVFERFIDKEEEKKEKRIKLIKALLLGVVGVFGALNALGYYLDQSQASKAKYVMEDGGRAIKSN